MSTTITIGIFDDHPILAHGLRSMLAEHSHLSVSFVALTHDDLALHLEREQPMLLFCDVVAPGVEGLDLFKYVASNFPTVAMIAYTTLNSAILVENLLAIGVKGFLNKRQPESHVLATIDTVCAGNIAVPAQFDFLVRSRSQDKQAIELSDREKQILGKIIAGRLTKEIADELNISKNTVENHRAKLFRKLDVQNVAELIKKAMNLGYLAN